VPARFYEVPDGENPLDTGHGAGLGERMISVRGISTSGAVLVLLVAGACGGGNDGDGPGQKKAAPAPPAPKATWSQVSLPLQQLQGGTAVSFDDSLAAGPGGPGIVIGQRSLSGRPSQALVWPATGGRPAVLDIDGDVVGGNLVADGQRTLAIGYAWQHGREQSWIQTSTDRTSWRSVALPADLAKQDALLSSAVPLGGGETLLVALDREHALLAQPLAGGKLVTLPGAGGKSRYTNVSGVGRIGTTILVVASATKPDGATTLVGLRSGDAGATWRRTSAPSAPGATVSGMVTAGNRFVATGWTSRSDAVPAAWSTRDGSTWTRERVPPLPRQAVGWDAYLSTPVVSDGTVYAAGINAQTLSATVLKRVAGTWTTLGQTSDWTTPGAPSLVAPTAGGVAVARSIEGKATLGTLGPGGFRPGSSLGTPQHTGSWDTPALFDGRPDLSFSRRVVNVRPQSGWATTISTQQLQVNGTSAKVRGAQPPKARGLASTSVASDPDGSTVVMGTDIHYDNTQGVADDTDLTGYFRGKSGGWKQVAGLRGPRTEQLSNVYRLGKTWVALGYDRGDFNSGAHEFAAVWTSTNGTDWTRQQANFDINPSQNSYFTGACETSDKGLVVVGGSNDAARGSVPMAWQRAGKTWKRLSLGSLGGDLQSLSGCVSTGGITLLQGDTSDGSGLWRTTDLKSFDKITIAGKDDTVQTVRPVEGGFAAAGGRYSGRLSQPVVWLSTDGRTWTPVPVARTARWPATTCSSGRTRTRTSSSYSSAATAGPRCRPSTTSPSSWRTPPSSDRSAGSRLRWRLRAGLRGGPPRARPRALRAVLVQGQHRPDQHRADPVAPAGARLGLEAQPVDLDRGTRDRHPAQVLGHQPTD